MEFADLIDYIHLGVFKYLSLADRIKFERLNSHCKMLLCNSTADLDKFRLDDDREQLAIESQIRELVLRFPNLSVLPYQAYDDILMNFVVEDFAKQLVDSCRKLVDFSANNVENKVLFTEYTLGLGESGLKSLTIAVDREDVFDWSKLCAAVQKSQLIELGLTVTSPDSQDVAINEDLQQFIDLVAPRITKLVVDHVDAIVGQLNKFTNLVKFEYSTWDYNGHSSNLVLRLPKLKKLHLSCHNMGNAEFASLTGLTVINFSSMSMLINRNSELIFELIKNNYSSLEKLTIENNFLEDDFAEDSKYLPKLFAVLKKCTKLRKFEFMAHPDFELEKPNEDIEFLSNNPRLRFLDLSWKVLREVSELEVVLKTLPKLRHLSLDINVGEFDNLVPCLKSFEEALINYANCHPKRRIDVEYSVDCDGDEIIEPLPFKIVNNLTLTDVAEEDDEEDWEDAEDGDDPDEEGSDDEWETDEEEAEEEHEVGHGDN